MAAAPALALDHLVVAARTLDEAAAWSVATLGVAPVPGGRHAGIGTHNRLLALGGERFPRSYLELIAVDPGAPAPATPRWFDLDDPAMHASLASGPRLVHWVVRIEPRAGATPDDDLASVRASLGALGHDVGPVVAARRDTPRGELSWRITRRADGVRPARGAVPLLIAWGDRHPGDDLPASPVRIERIAIGGVEAAVGALLGVVVDPDPAAPPLAVRLATPLGRIDLVSGG